MTGVSEADFVRLRIETTLRYRGLRIGEVPRCSEHPTAGAIQVTSVTRKWVGDDEHRTFPTTIEEHAPVCSACFTPLLPEEADVTRTPLQPEADVAR